MFCSVKCQKANKVRQWQKKNAFQRKLNAIQKLGGKCSRCSYRKNLAALTFHHLDPSKKDFELDSRKFSNTSLKKLEKEIEKCILLCIRCHVEEHNPHLDLDLGLLTQLAE